MKNFKEVLKGKDGYEFSVSFWLPDGKVKGIKKGSATITVTMKSGAKATFKVTVKK